MILYLLRHAKSSWNDASLRDHDRPLSPRGERGARAIGRWLAEREAQPDLVLCSSARRTVETLDRVLAELPRRPEVKVEPELYLSAPSALLARLQQVGRGAGVVLMVGHNPATEELAAHLPGTGEPDAAQRIRTKYPTGAVAEVHFEGDDWGRVQLGSGRLVAFCTPRDLQN